MTLGLVAPAASAAELANYPFASSSPASVDADPGSTAANFVLTATGATISPTSENLYLRSNATSATTEAQSIAAGTYVGFTITPTGGNVLNLSSLAFRHGASNSPNDGVFLNASVAVKSSVGGFGESDPTLATFTKTLAANNGGSGVLDARSIDLASLGSTFQNLATPVEFRFYLFDDQDHVDRINRLDSVVLNGTAVPEPATIGALGLGACGLLLRRRRRRDGSADVSW